MLSLMLMGMVMGCDEKPDSNGDNNQIQDNGKVIAEELRGIYYERESDGFSGYFLLKNHEGRTCYFELLLNTVRCVDTLTAYNEIIFLNSYTINNNGTIELWGRRYGFNDTTDRKLFEFVEPNVIKYLSVTYERID